MWEGSEEMKTVNGYRLRQSSLGGNSVFLKTVYTNLDTAKLIAEDKTEEWTDFTPEPVTVRMLTETEGDCDGDVVTIDNTTPDQIHRERAMKVLTKEQKKALGLL